MSELVNNLQSIYNIKLQIKDVLGTDSDLFEDYPDLIEEAIGEGGGSGSSADPWYGGTFTLDMIVNEESSADYVCSAISENFTATLDENDEVEAVEWDENITIDVEGTDVDKVVHVIVNGDPHDMLSTASTIERNFEDYSDLYNNIYPILENATLTASEDPSGDGYDYLLEGDLYAWNLIDNCAQVEEITENGFVPANDAMGYNVNVPIPTIASKVASITSNGRYNAQSVDSVDGWSEVTVAVPIPTIASKRAEITANGRYYAQSVDSVDGWSEVTVNVPSSGITPTGKFNNFIFKEHDGNVFCLYPTQNDSNTYADIAGDAKLYNIILEGINPGVAAYDYTEYYFTDSTGTKLSYQYCYPCFDSNSNVSNAVIYTSTNFNFIAGTEVNLYAVFHSVIQDPDWSPNPDMPDEVPIMIDTPGTPYQLYFNGETDFPGVINGENYYVIFGEEFYYNGYLEGYLDDGTVTP